MIVPRHALVAWSPARGGDGWLHLETTWIGQRSFDEAYEEGQRRAGVNQAQLTKTGDAGWYRRRPLRGLREQGIHPIPLTGGDELGRMARALEAMGRRQAQAGGSSASTGSIDTGGGAYIAGDVHTGGDFVGRDKK